MENDLNNVISSVLNLLERRNDAQERTARYREAGRTDALQGLREELNNADAELRNLFKNNGTMQAVIDQLPEFRRLATEKARTERAISAESNETVKNSLNSQLNSINQRLSDMLNVRDITRDNNDPNQVNPTQNRAWGPLSPEEIDDAIQLGFTEYTPGDGADFDRFLIDHGYNPEKLKNQLDKRASKDTPTETKDKEPAEVGAGTIGQGLSLESELRRIFSNNGIAISDDDIKNLVKNNKAEINGQEYQIDYSGADGYDYTDEPATPFKLVVMKDKKQEKKPEGPVPPVGNPVPPKDPDDTKPERPEDNPIPPRGPEDRNPVPPTDNPVPPKVPEDDINKNNLPVRSFWEIYEDTHKDHIGTLRRSLHFMAHMPLWPKKEDTVEKILNVPGLVIKLPLKLATWPINKVLRTDKKYQDEYKRVRELAEKNPAEFDVLVSSAKDVNEKYEAKIKQDIDTDYLEPNLMKQAKVNNMYLDVVEMVLKERTEGLLNGKDGKSGLNKAIVNMNKRINELSAKVKDGSITPEEKSELNNLSKKVREVKGYAKEEADKYISFREGAKLKTGSFRNISGWFLGKYNPNNIDSVVKPMSKLAKQRREAIENGDQLTADSLSSEMNELMSKSTKIVHVGHNENNKIDRGDTSIDEGKPVELLDRGTQSKTRKTLSAIAIGTVFGRFLYTHLKNQAIESHNAEIENANQNNSNISYSQNYSQPYSHQYNQNVQVVDQNTIDRAADNIAGTKIAGGHSVGEYSNLDQSALENAGTWSSGLNSAKYTARDAALHTDTTNVANSVANATNNVQKISAAENYYQAINGTASNAARNYAASHPQFAYNGYEYGLNLSGPNTAGAVEDLFRSLGNGTINVSGTVNGIATGTINGVVSGTKVAEMELLSYVPDIAVAAGMGTVILNAAEKDIQEKTKRKMAERAKKNYDKQVEKTHRANKAKSNDGNLEK